MQVHTKLNNTHLALMHFSWATDLDPKGAHSQIKDTLDPLLSRAAQEDAAAPAAAVNIVADQQEDESTSSESSPTQSSPQQQHQMDLG
jgi:anaphase-promoting complex subunit 3